VTRLVFLGSLAAFYRERAKIRLGALVQRFRRRAGFPSILSVASPAGCRGGLHARPGQARAAMSPARTIVAGLVARQFDGNAALGSLTAFSREPDTARIRLLALGSLVAWACAPAPLPAPVVAPKEACATLSDCDVGCDRGELRDCFEVGRRLRRHGGDAARTRDLLDRACAGGVLDACAELGALYRFGDGVERNVERARALYEQACDGGSLVGCTALGALHQAGVSSLGRDLPRAHRMFRASCEGGEQTGCTLLALAILRGEIAEAPEDPARLLDRACAADVPEACALRGELFLRDPRGDPETAVAHFERSCDDGASAGCVALAYLHLEGKLVPQDADRASTLLERACRIDGASCGHLAARKARGPSPDPAAAAALYDRACERWDPKSCLALSEMLDAGEGTPANPARARALRARACELGAKQACP
jgi:TPR repeat protein